MQAKALIPRLKTTLFILSSQFGVDLNDPKQLSLIPGEVTPEMVRKVSYYLIEAHNLGRSLLVCDEAENASFIFDSKYLEELGFKSDDLLSLTKNELKEYIEQYPDMGRRMLYTSRFVSNMINAIESPQSTIISEPKREITLVPISPASERIESSTGISKKFEIPPLVINKAIMSLEEEGKLGEVGIYKFVSNTTRGYTPEQQDTIFQWLQDNELLIKKPPEGVLSMRGLRHNLGISSTIAEQAIEALRGTPGFGPVKTYRFQKPTHGYTPEQQAQILQWVIEKRQGASVEMPEDYKSMSAIVKTLNVDHPLTERLINELQVDDKFGIPQLYSLKGKPVRGFSPEQQAMIKDRLQQAGAFLETAPEGYLSFTGLGELLGIDKSTIKKYADIAQKTGAISDIRPYKFYSAKVPGLSPEQQAIIIEKLRNSGALLESPPEDYLSVKGLARKLGIDPHSLDKQVKALQETGKLHGMRYHKFGSVPARALSPSQQEIVANSLREQ
jgi:biotin operon repressor